MTMLVTDFHYHAVDMESYVDDQWRHQVEPVDLSCSTAAIPPAANATYAEPLDLSTPRRAQVPQYDMDLYFSPPDPECYDPSRYRRWGAPESYAGYDGQMASYQSDTYDKVRPWTVWEPHGSGMHHFKPDTDKPQPHFVQDSYPERPSCAFSRNQPSPSYRDLYSYTGYPLHIGSEYDRSVYHTNGGSYKYLRNRADLRRPYSRVQDPPPPQSTGSSVQSSSRNPDIYDSVKDKEDILMYVSNNKQFTGGFVISRKDNSPSAKTEVLPPISITDFTFSEHSADDKDTATDPEEKPERTSV